MWGEGGRAWYVRRRGTGLCEEKYKIGEDGAVKRGRLGKYSEDGGQGQVKIELWLLYGQRGVGARGLS